MSAFWTNCQTCGERYFHMFVGTKLIHGHDCPVRRGLADIEAGRIHSFEDVFGEPQTPPTNQAEAS